MSFGLSGPAMGGIIGALVGLVEFFVVFPLLVKSIRRQASLLGESEQSLARKIEVLRTALLVINVATFAVGGYLIGGIFWS
jgi:hypothetical protein